MSFCTDRSDNVMYMLSGLAEEVGELHGKFAKNIRKGMINEATKDFNFDWGKIGDSMREIQDAKCLIKSEAGDVLWMLAGFCQKMGWTLEEVAQMNLDKLTDRKERNVIVGEGDKR